jgi:hypothetical protein
VSAPPADKEARIAEYARRVAAGLRLFEPTPAVTPPADRPNRRACIGCGRETLKGWGKGSRPRGWVVRRLPGSKWFGVEIHCPLCVRRWGVGVGLEQEPKEPSE